MSQALYVVLHIFSLIFITTLYVRCYYPHIADEKNWVYGIVQRQKEQNHQKLRKDKKNYKFW